MSASRGERFSSSVKRPGSMLDQSLIFQVSKEKKGKMVDSRCRDLTSAFACEKGRAEPGSVPLCSYHEVRLSDLGGMLYPADRDRN